MTLEKFLSAVDQNVSRIHAYKNAEDGSNGTCDCIGQIIGAVRLCGEKWAGTHGSNYTARNRVANFRYVDAASELNLGELVFKARNSGDAGYSLPGAYKNHSDQRDYYHVGVVTSVSPQVITHCTSVEGGIQRDSKLGKWHYAGELDLIDKTEGGEAIMTDPVNVKVTAQSGNTVNLRSEPNTNSRVLKHVYIGTVIQAIGTYNNEWTQVNADGTIGFIMSKFLVRATADDGEMITITMPKETAINLVNYLNTALGG